MIRTNNPCFLQTSNTLGFFTGYGVLSIELPSLTSVGQTFQVYQQADVTRVVLSELRTVAYSFGVSRNPALTYLSVPKLASVSGSISICRNSADFSRPSSATNTWPAVNPTASSTCTLQGGDAACPSPASPCSSYVWPS